MNDSNNNDNYNNNNNVGNSFVNETNSDDFDSHNSNNNNTMTKDNDHKTTSSLSTTNTERNSSNTRQMVTAELRNSMYDISQVEPVMDENNSASMKQKIRNNSDSLSERIEQKLKQQQQQQHQQQQRLYNSKATMENSNNNKKMKAANKNHASDDQTNRQDNLLPSRLEDRIAAKIQQHHDQHQNGSLTNHHDLSNSVQRKATTRLQDRIAAKLERNQLPTETIVGKNIHATHSAGQNQIENSGRFEDRLARKLQQQQQTGHGNRSIKNNKQPKESIVSSNFNSGTAGAKNIVITPHSNNNNHSTRKRIPNNDDTNFNQRLAAVQFVTNNSDGRNSSLYPSNDNMDHSSNNDDSDIDDDMFSPKLTNEVQSSDGKHIIDSDNQDFIPGAYFEQGMESIAVGAEHPLSHRLDPPNYSQLLPNHDNYNDPGSRSGHLSISDQQDTTPRSNDVSSAGLHGLTEAHMVSEAETVLYAEEVEADTSKRNRIIAMTMTTITIILLIVLSTVLTQNRRNKEPTVIDPRCLLPVKEQHIAVRCLCSNSTASVREEMTKLQTMNYQLLYSGFQQLGVIDPLLEIPDDSCLVENQALLYLATVDGIEFILSGDSMFVSVTVFSEFYALALIYLEMGGLFWERTDSWFQTTLVCEWFGVECLTLETIHSIVLPSNGLAGTIPHEIRFLGRLRSFDFSNNPNIVGTIPSELSDLTTLNTLILTDTSLTGTLSTELGRLERLDTLDISNTKISGTIPTEFGNFSVLRTFTMSNNTLTGTIPTELGLLKNLQWLDIKQNNLVGSLPTEFAKPPNIEVLHFAINNLSGQIPESFASLSRLEFINLFESGVGGMIPDSFCTANVREASLAVLGSCESNTKDDTNLIDTCLCCADAFAFQPSPIRLFCSESVPPELIDRIFVT